MWTEKPSSQTRLLKVCLWQCFDPRSVNVLYTPDWKAFYLQCGFNATLQWWWVSHWSQSFFFSSHNCDIQAFKNIFLEQSLGTRQLLGGCEGWMEFCKNSIPKMEQRDVEGRKKVCMHCNSVTVCLFNTLTSIKALKQDRFCTSVPLARLVQWTTLADNQYHTNVLSFLPTWQWTGIDPFHRPSSTTSTKLEKWSETETLLWWRSVWRGGQQVFHSTSVLANWCSFQHRIFYIYMRILQSPRV